MRICPWTCLRWGAGGPEEFCDRRILPYRLENRAFVGRCAVRLEQLRELTGRHLTRK